MRIAISLAIGAVRQFTAYALSFITNVRGTSNGVDVRTTSNGDTRITNEIA
jgi:hypothetical protein